VKISKKLLKQIIREELESYEANLDIAHKNILDAAEKIAEFHSKKGDTRKDTIKAIEGQFEEIANTGGLDDILDRYFPLNEGRCGCHGCPGDHGEILVAYDPTGKEVMRSKAFRDDEADQLTALVPVLQAQGLAVEIIPAPHEHPIAVSVMDAPEEKIH